MVFKGESLRKKRNAEGILLYKGPGAKLYRSLCYRWTFILLRYTQFYINLSFAMASATFQ